MAIEFSGTGQYFQATNPLSAVPLTFACWFNTDAATSFHRLVSISEGGTVNNYFSLFTDTADLKGQTFDTNSAVSTIATVVASSWQHGAMVSGAVASRFAYLDGVESTEETTSRTPTGLDSLDIGILDNNAFIQPWDGLMYWVAVWDDDLSASQVQNLADGYSPLTVARHNLVFFARFASTDPIDMIGNRALVATGTPTAATDPDGMKRILPRGRGRSRLRLN